MMLLPSAYTSFGVFVFMCCIGQSDVAAAKALDGIIYLASEHGNETYQYSNKYVFKFENSDSRAQRICESVGLTFKKKILTSKDVSYYLCEDDSPEGRTKRSAVTRNVVKETSLKSQPGVLDAKQEVYVKIAPTSSQISRHSRKTRSLTISDSQWDNMWHLQPSHYPSMNVYEAWVAGYTGQGITVAIVDTGVDIDHTDLDNNYRPDLSYDYLSWDSNPSHSATDSGHGTNCAGIVAAEANGECAIGVAYQAEFGALRMLDEIESGTVSTIVSSLNHALTSYDIYSNSWGYVTDGERYVSIDDTMEEALRIGATQGRDGKGAIYTFSAGNDEQLKDDANAQNLLSNIYTIAIGSVSPDGSPAYYSTPGACVMASTYGGDLYDNAIGIITTDRNSNCMTDFQGTSAACPVASGIIALALQANPGLTWRDIQHLIVETSTTSGLTGGSFITNGAGHLVSNYFGFGLMNAQQMVNRARTWSNVEASTSCTSNEIYPFSSGSYGTVAHSYTISDSECAITKLEHVQVAVVMDCTDYGNVAIYLTSPSGTHSMVMRHRPNCVVSGIYYWDYGSVQFWDETSRGTWTITLIDSGYTYKELLYWQMTMYGTSKTSAADSYGLNLTLAAAVLSVWAVFF